MNCVNPNVNPKPLPKNHRHQYYSGSCERPGSYPVLTKAHAPIWNNITNINEDPCTQRVDEMQSALPGCYHTNNFFRYCESQNQYSNLMTEPGHYYKPYRNACQVDTDSVLRYADLTNKGEIYELYTRSYKQVPYMGAGSNSTDPDLRVLESQILQGHATTNDKPCERTSGITYNRMHHLPDYGNPQRLVHVLEDLFWVRPGENTRDYVRRVNYEKACLNRVNNNIVNRTE